MYRNMIKYAQCYAKLITSRDVLTDVNQDAHPDEIKTAKCECGKETFVWCPWRSKFVCFHWICYKYHPESYKPVSLVWRAKYCSVNVQRLAVVKYSCIFMSHPRPSFSNMNKTYIYKSETGWLCVRLCVLLGDGSGGVFFLVSSRSVSYWSR
jgi:hypothetical protein